jgi:hypothetical protein
MPTSMPTRLGATTDSHSAHVAPCFESAPHNLEVCCSHPMHTASTPTGRAYSGHRRPISCPVSRISSPQTPFNPHISTALTAYCKSPYPHCSAPAASDQENFCSRSTVDTAPRDFATVEMSHRRGLTKSSFSELLNRFLLPQEVHALHDKPITRG